MRLRPAFQPVHHALARGALKLFACNDVEPRLERLVACLEFGDRRAVPDQTSVFGEVNRRVGRRRQPRRPGRDLERDHRFGCTAQHRPMHALRLQIGHEYKSLQAADIFALHQHLAVARHRRHKILVLAQSLHQDACAAVDEPLRQTLMQSVGKLILYRTRALLPMRRILEPVRPVRNIGPGSDVSEAGRQRVDVAIRPVDARHLTREPLFGNLPGISHQVEINAGQKGRMFACQRLSEVRNLRHVPQSADGRRGAGDMGDVLVMRHPDQRVEVLGHRAAGEAGTLRAHFKAPDERRYA
jgi:hypothetical protein